MSLLVRAEVAPSDIPYVPNLINRAQRALKEAVEEVGKEIETKGRADIAAAGSFGARWTEGFTVQVLAGGDYADLDVTEDVPYWTVFQFGATIQGRPLLFFKPTKAVGGLTGMGNNMPMLISKHSVTIPKKFHLIEIATEEAEKVPLLFQQKIKEAGPAAD